jgi:hypothetical protein
MGMFDHITCKFGIAQEHKELEFQTKDTPNQSLDNYRIDDSGQLWVEDYDVEDRSDPNAKGWDRFVGCITRVNKRWEKINNFTGNINFYTNVSDGDWIEYEAVIENGLTKKISKNE